MIALLIDEMHLLRICPCVVHITSKQKEHDNRIIRSACNTLPFLMTDFSRLYAYSLHSKKPHLRARHNFRLWIIKSVSFFGKKYKDEYSCLCATEQLVALATCMLICFTMKIGENEAVKKERLLSYTKSVMQFAQSMKAATPNCAAKKPHLNYAIDWRKLQRPQVFSGFCSWSHCMETFFANKVPFFCGFFCKKQWSVIMVINHLQ